MTNREWLEKLSDEELAKLLIEYNPTCDDIYGWQDRYTNPCDRKYDEFFGNKIEVFNYYYDETIKEMVQWLQVEHKE